LAAAHSLHSVAPSSWRIDAFPEHPVIAASIVLYIGLRIIVAITVWNYWKVAHP
jgi:hypothetical protein